MIKHKLVEASKQKQIFYKNMHEVQLVYSKKIIKSKKQLTPSE